MTFSLKKTDVLETACHTLALFWPEEGPQGAAKDVDDATGGYLSAVAKEERFKGGAEETLLVRMEGRLPAARVLLVGMGPENRVSEEQVRLACAAVLNAAKHGDVLIALDVPAAVGPFATAKAAAEGAFLAMYHYGHFKEKKHDGPDSITVAVADAKALRPAKDGFALGLLFAEGTAHARDLVNHPGGHLTPAELAKAAEGLVKGKPGLSFTSFRKAELKKMGAGGLLGVAQGSDHDPVLVHMVYKPAKKAKKRVALVGKAVTFDSGGLSLKNASGMETMKCDMAGAAAVIGAFAVLDRIKPNVEVHGIFGACENMPSGKALRPGDVVKTLSGKTIEILNTDAEGRVTLADSLTYASRQNPDVIVDLATLTGACVVALGEEITGLMSNDRTVAAQVKAAAGEAGENVWELPLEPAYKKEIKSDVADYKNTTSRWGGTLTAGLLLEEFVDGRPWAHLDIAGPAYAEKPLNAYTKKGGTGHGVRTLLAWLRGM